MVRNLEKYLQKVKRVLGMPKPSIYVASGIEHAGSLEWRDWLKQQLQHKYNVILPDVYPNPPHQKGDLAYPEWVYKNFIDPDITDVCSCNHFFVFIDESFHLGAGGKAEATFASVLNKPITYCLHNMQFNDLNGWVMGCLHNAHQVSDLKEAVNYYKSL